MIMVQFHNGACVKDVDWKCGASIWACSSWTPGGVDWLGYHARWKCNWAWNWTDMRCEVVKIKDGNVCKAITSVATECNAAYNDNSICSQGCGKWYYTYKWTHYSCDMNGTNNQCRSCCEPTSTKCLLNGEVVDNSICINLSVTY